MALTVLLRLWVFPTLLCHPSFLFRLLALVQFMQFSEQLCPQHLVLYITWSMRFGEEVVSQLILQGAELAYLPQSERIYAFLDSISDRR
jgi:hypothetical protein